MNHDRALARAIRSGVLQVEALRQVEVQLDRRHLPRASDGVLGLDGDLRPVEGGPALVQDQLEALLLSSLAQDLGCLSPHLV